MDAAKAQVLFDIALLATGALAFGIPLFALLRRRDPEIGWGHHGNVWTPFDRLDLVAAFLLFAFFTTNVILPVVMGEQIEAAAAGAKEGEGANLTPLLIIVVNAVFNITLGAGVFCFVSIIRRRDPVQLFGLDRLSIPKVLLWSAGGLVIAYIAVAAGALTWQLVFEKQWGGSRDLQEVVTQLLETKDVMLQILILITAVVIAPIVEEILFRGFLYPVFKRYSDRFFAAVVTSILFAVVHGNVPGMLPLFLLALVLTAAYELSGCLWVPIAIHAAFNGTQSALMLIFKDSGAL